MNHKILKLHGQIQHYAWGGYKFIPELLEFDNAQHKPCAEYWMGAHPAASGKMETEQGMKQWYDMIKEDPVKLLGEKIYERFGELPYLLKVLDVHEMLSIQVHPAKEEAEKGYDAEEKAGIPINAKTRNYKDRNHKPEVMIALSDFWLLHGFKEEHELRNILQLTREFHGLVDVFDNDGYFGLYKCIMEMPQPVVDSMLLPLLQREAITHQSEDEPGYWVNKLYRTNIPETNIDRGVFSIYFFNIVYLCKGQGIFQAAGVPHAYLQGQNVELMANSDNVLRGGLTPKHIDVPELLKHINFEGTEPHILIGNETANGESIYTVPAEDFGISMLNIVNGREYVNESTSPETFFVMKGEVHCDGIDAKKGDSFVILPATRYTIRSVKDAVLYKAYVPQTR